MLDTAGVLIRTSPGGHLRTKLHAGTDCALERDEPRSVAAGVVAGALRVVGLERAVWHVANGQRADRLEATGARRSCFIAGASQSLCRLASGCGHPGYRAGAAADCGIARADWSGGIGPGQQPAEQSQRAVPAVAAAVSSAGQPVVRGAITLPDPVSARGPGGTDLQCCVPPGESPRYVAPVSYTHLMLPTIFSV